MMDELFASLCLSISFDEFRALPTNPAFKYEYFEGRAHLSARPKYYAARLDLAAGEAPDLAEADSWGRSRLRRLGDSDWDHLPTLFAAAFSRVQPFSAMAEESRLEAACQCLKKTRTAKDGPIVERACWVAAREDDGLPVAAALVTLQPREEEHLDPFDDGPDDPRLDPHLTWIFVRPLLARHGIGTALLANVSRSLIDLGYDRLDSTFLLGNESSTLWHWRNGFRLLDYAVTPRWVRRWREKARADSETSKAPDPPC